MAVSGPAASGLGPSIAGIGSASIVASNLFSGLRNGSRLLQSLDEPGQGKLSDLTKFSLASTNMSRNS